MYIQRKLYLDKLIKKKGNGLIKVITGLRRSGKSYLLFNIFKKHLTESGTAADHIIEMSFEGYENRQYRNADLFYPYVKEKITDSRTYYILLDEVQLLDSFEEVLNGFLHIPNADVYVTSSNAKFLSRDIITEFRGRGDEIYISPLSFAEFMQCYSGDRYMGLGEYMAYGGLPYLINLQSHEEKAAYLKNIFEETYITDIINRHSLRGKAEFNELIDILSSSVGSLTNPNKLSATFKSVKNVKVSPLTLTNYIGYLEDSFLISKAMRYDVKGKKYINSPSKYYFTDVGLRNARLNFRQTEETHLMENVIYNELIIRGYNVDVGIVTSFGADGKTRKQSEVDFVCNSASKRYYIQSALTVSDEDKSQQEQYSLLHINDSFKKIIIVKDPIVTRFNENGILLMNIYDFLLNYDSLDF
ncbi:MAG: ATP-binding protein [Clostridia bacterium]|nr:ATP-binding protein [Clostridia bacterium]